MFDHLKHKARQLYYRFWRFSNNSYYTLFHEMYQYNKSLFSWIIPHPSQNGYFITSFLCPDHAKYQGREIVYFDNKRLAVFWLPGADHSAQGFVKSGTYNCLLDKFSVKRSVNMTIEKTDNSTDITHIALQKKQAHNNQIRLDGGYVKYSAIELELSFLITQWFSNNCTIKNNFAQDRTKLNKIIQLASQVPNKAIQSLACDFDNILSKKINAE